MSCEVVEQKHGAVRNEGLCVCVCIQRTNLDVCKLAGVFKR